MTPARKRHCPGTPHGRGQPSHQKSTCLTQLTSGPNVVQIWSRNPQLSEAKQPSDFTEWNVPDLVNSGSERASTSVLCGLPPPPDPAPTPPTPPTPSSESSESEMEYSHPSGMTPVVFIFVFDFGLFERCLREGSATS